MKTFTVLIIRCDLRKSKTLINRLINILHKFFNEIAH